MATPSTFDPLEFGFVPLRDVGVGPGVETYELANHPVVDGTWDPARLNLYLSKDGDYVVVWEGLMSPLFSSWKLGELGLPEAGRDDMLASYEEVVFRGRLGTAETAGHVMEAVGIRRHGHLPQVLRVVDGGIACDLLPAPEGAATRRYQGRGPTDASSEGQPLAMSSSRPGRRPKA